MRTRRGWRLATMLVSAAGLRRRATPPAETKIRRPSPAARRAAELVEVRARPLRAASARADEVGPARPETAARRAPEAGRRSDDPPGPLLEGGVGCRLLRGEERT